MNKQELRHHLKAQREALSPLQRECFAQQMVSHVITLPLYEKATHLGFYWGKGAEMNPTFLLETALKAGKKCYLPVVPPLHQETLCFIPYTAQTPLSPNQYGVLEPPYSEKEIHPLETFHIIFVPLVGFDMKGHRLGMGGGFYDKTFSYQKKTPEAPPVLLGLAYECQKVETLPVDEWDIPLKGIITESNPYIF